MCIRDRARDDLKVTQNNLQYKAAELKAKGAAYRRQQLLREAGLSSQADLEAAEFEAKGAEYDMHAYEALVESGQAEVHRLEIEIDQTILRAPFSGVVVRRYVREGQAIVKGDKCFRVSQLYPLQVQFQISELARDVYKRQAWDYPLPSTSSKRTVAACGLKAPSAKDRSSLFPFLLPAKPRVVS